MHREHRGLGRPLKSGECQHGSGSCQNTPRLAASSSCAWGTYSSRGQIHSVPRRQKTTKQVPSKSTSSTLSRPSFPTRFPCARVECSLTRGRRPSPIRPQPLLLGDSEQRVPDVPVAQPICRRQACVGLHAHHAHLGACPSARRAVEGGGRKAVDGGGV